MTRRLLPLLLLAALATAVNWGSPFLPEAHLADDTLVYWQCAHWMHQGLTMYVDMFDHKGPLTYLFYFIGDYGGSHGVWALSTVWIAFGLATLYRLCRSQCGPTDALLGTVTAYALLYSCEGLKLLPFLALPFICLGLKPLLLALTQRRQPTPREVAAAALCCLALFNIKPDLSAPIAIVGLLAVALNRPTVKQLGQYTAIFATLFAAGGALLYAVLTHYGAWEAYVDCFWRFNFAYTASNEADKYHDLLLLFTRPQMLFVYALSAYTLARARGGEAFRGVLLVALSALAAMCITAVPCGRNYTHHLSSGMPLVAVLAAQAHALTRPRKWLSTASLASLVAAVAVVQVYRAPNLSAYNSADLFLAHWINDHIPAGEKIQAPAVLYKLSGRQCSTDFFFLSPMETKRKYPTLWSKYSAELRRSRPVVVAYQWNLPPGPLLEVLGPGYHVWPISGTLTVLLRFD